LKVNGVDLAALEHPAGEDVLGAVLTGAVIGLDELRRHPRGKVFDVAAVVAPPDPGRPADLRLHLGDHAALDGLEELLIELPHEAPFRLVSRRTMRMKNSWGQDFPEMVKWFPHENPVWMHPDDMTAIGVCTGDRVAVRSVHGTICCTAEEDPTARTGVVSVSHGWGGPGRPGANVNELTDDLDAGDAITAIPHMSGLPVWVERPPS
jgi:anaerobic selenocysteine-containing dehydrogenase